MQLPESFLENETHKFFEILIYFRLTDFNGMSVCLGLFYANRITFISKFFMQIFFFLYEVLPNTDDS